MIQRRISQPRINIAFFRVPLRQIAFEFLNFFFQRTAATRGLLLVFLFCLLRLHLWLPRVVTRFAAHKVPRVIRHFIDLRRSGRLRVLRLTARRQPCQIVIDIAVEFFDFAIGHQQKAVAYAAQQRAIVRHQHQAAFVFRQRHIQRVTHFQIQMIGRLVEQQQIRPCAYHQRQCQARLFAAGKGADLFRYRIASEVKTTKVIAQILLARFRLFVDHVPQRRFIGPQLLQLVLREITDGESFRFQSPARQWLAFAREQLDQRGFACAIRPEQADARTGAQRHFHAADDGHAVVTGIHFLQTQHRIGRALRRHEFKIKRRIDVGGRHQLHAIQRLQAALRLPCLGGRRAKARNVAVQMRHLPLLLFKQRLLHRQRCRTLHFKAGVVTGVERQPLGVDMRDVRGAAIEKITIVRHHHQRAAKRTQPFFQPHHRVQIQVVGRLVEQHQIAAAYQRLRQIQTHAPAAGELRHRPLDIPRGKTQPRQQRRRPRFGAVAADVIQAPMQFAQQIAAFMMRFGLGQFALDLAQLGVAIQHVFNRRHFQRRRLLRHRGNAPRGRHVAITQIGMQLAA